MANHAVDVTVEFLRQVGSPITKTYRIHEGPGRVRLRVLDEVGVINEHGTAIAARTLSGALSPVTVERTLVWGADRRESASAVGAPAPGRYWFFAEGGKGTFTTYVLLANPSATQTASVRVFYFHDNGNLYYQDYTVPPKSRRTAASPASMPDGGFGIYAGSLDGSTFVVERSVYDAATFELGSSETGTPMSAARWRFAEGAVSGYWSVFFVMLNPSWTQAVPVRLTYRRTDGTVVTQQVTVPVRGRLAVNPAGVMGGSVTYATDVEATDGSPIVVERAMYWPTWAGWHGSHVSLGRPQ